MMDDGLYYTSIHMWQQERLDREKERQQYPKESTDRYIYIYVSRYRDFRYDWMQ